MTVLDAYAVVAYLRDEPCAEEVAALLNEPTVLTAVNAAEVIDQLVRVFGRDADDVHGDIALLANAGVEILAVSSDVGLLAGRLRARHSHRQRSAVSLADCVAGAAALTLDRSLATADPALAAMVRSEGGRIHGLVDSSGVLP